MGYKAGRFLSIIVAAGSLAGCIDPVGLVFNTDQVLAYHLGQSQPTSTQNSLSTYFSEMSCELLQQTIKAYEAPHYSTPEGTTARQQATLIYTQRGCSASEAGAVQKPIESKIATTAPPITPTPPAQEAIGEPAKSKKTRNFCLAYLAAENTYGATISPIQEKHDYDGSGTSMLASLKSYIAKVKQVQPGVWGDFDDGVISCASNTHVCLVQTKGGLFAKKQTAGQFCHFTLAEAEAELAQMHNGDPSAKTVAWP